MNSILNILGVKKGSKSFSSAAETGQMSSVEIGQMSAIEPGQIGQMSAVETRQMYSIKTGQRPVAIVDVCLVSTCISKDRKAH